MSLGPRSVFRILLRPDDSEIKCCAVPNGLSGIQPDGNMAQFARQQHGQLVYQIRQEINNTAILYVTVWP